MATKQGGKNKKYGRNKRAPSNAGQALRTARNKRRNIERDIRQKAKIAARKAKKKIVRGATRKIKTLNAAS